MKEIKDAHDLADVFKSGELINEEVFDDPEKMEKLEEIFKDFPKK